MFQVCYNITTFNKSKALLLLHKGLHGCRGTQLPASEVARRGERCQENPTSTCYLMTQAAPMLPALGSRSHFLKDAWSVMLSGSDPRRSRPAGSVEADVLFPPLRLLEWRTSVSKENCPEKVVSEGCLRGRCYDWYNDESHRIKKN